MGAVYTQLSVQERRRIEDWWHAKVPVAQMARVLKRHKSTIFREIKRNFWAGDAFPKKYAGYFRMASSQARYQGNDSHDIKQVCDRLNNTPRKCLGWKTPAELFTKNMLAEIGRSPYPQE